MDVSAVTASSSAAISVAEPLAGSTDVGGDILSLDLSAADAVPAPLVMRADTGEWLGAPMWLADGSAVVFQREDLRGGSDLYAGQAGVRYHSRIELFSPSTGRSVVVPDGHHPSPSPDGTQLAFVRVSQQGSTLIARGLVDGEERTLVPAGTVPDIAYPRYAPGGERIAFMATTAVSRVPALLAGWFELAHGLPWNLWVVQRDGSGLHQLAAVGADDASLAWSPDGTELMVYGSTGARIVDSATGATDVLTFLAGFGAIAWLP